MADIARWKDKNLARKSNDKNITQRFDDFMSSLSSVEKLT